MYDRPISLLPHPHPWPLFLPSIPQRLRGIGSEEGQEGMRGIEQVPYGITINVPFMKGWIEQW